jgi:hypothetical protein
MVVVIHVQIFTNKLPLNLIFHNPFLQLEHCDKAVAK